MSTFRGCLRVISVVSISFLFKGRASSFPNSGTRPAHGLCAPDSTLTGRAVGEARAGVIESRSRLNSV